MRFIDAMGMLVVWLLGIGLVVTACAFVWNVFAG